ncbi:MAG: hypothetical protein IE913_09015 [Halothiobacillus sp.]|nr:hypothetical protein [Halothiobacillus sp.]
MNSTPFNQKHLASALVVAFMVTVAPPVLAEPHDAKWGQELHAQHCAECHSAPHDAAFYTSKRAGKIKNLAGLNTMVQSCANHFNVPWFDEEVNAVSGYLNQTYYQFDRTRAD